MNKIPQTLSSEITAAINSSITESDRLKDWDDVKIQALVQAIEKLQKSDARSAFVSFGSVAAICGKTEDVLSYYAKALRLPEEAETKHEFWISMGNVALYAKAHEIGSWMLDPKRGFFPNIWQRAISLGHILEVWTRLADAKKTYPELLQEDFSALGSAVAIMQERGLSDKDIISTLDLMGEIQRDHRIMFAGDLVSFLKIIRPPDDAAYLYITIPIAADFDEIHTMNRELTRLVVKKLPNGTFPEGIVFSFAKAHSLELLAAA